MTEKTWEKQIEDLFIACGLSEKGALIYRILLENGDLPAKDIVGLSKIKKGNTYALLHNLGAEGLVTSFKREKKTWFRPESPRKLQELVRKKTAEVERTKSTLGDLLPKLSSQYKLAVGRPTIRYFEGREGLKEVFEDVYAAKKEAVLGAVDVDQVEAVFRGFPEGTLIPKRMKNKLRVKVLFNDTPFARKLHKLDKKQNRVSVILDKEKYPLPADIEAYEDKVALMSFREGEFMGMIIENKDFALTLRSIFAFIFDNLRTKGSGKKSS